MIVLTIIMLLAGAITLIIAALHNAAVAGKAVDTASTLYFSQTAIQYTDYTIAEWDTVWGGRYAD